MLNIYPYNWLNVVACSMLYQVRDHVTEQTLIMLYYSFACSRISYGITAWGTAADKY